MCTELASRMQRKSPSAKNAIALAVALLLPMSTAGADEAADWPNRPIRLVVNFAPGGAVDLVGRAVSVGLQSRVGQSVVVENRAGAGGAIGAESVAKAAPDGYTLLVSGGTLFSIAPFVYAKMPLDPFKDLVPVAPVSKNTQYLLVKNELPVKDGKAFLEYVQQHSANMSYGSPGYGSGPHLAGEMFKAKTGTSALHVPYKGAGPAFHELLAGRLDYLFDPGVALNQVEGGKARLIAIAGENRVARFPDIPTLQELGVKDFRAGTYFGIYAPAGTPAAIIRKINAEINKTLNDEALKNVILQNGAEVVSPMSADEFLKALEEEAARNGALVKERNIRAE